MDDQRDKEWHLDKRVPVALILGMAAQVAVVAWGAAIMFSDIKTNRDGIRSLDERLRTSELATGNQAVQLSRIEEQVRGLREDMNRLLGILERRFDDR